MRLIVLALLTGCATDRTLLEVPVTVAAAPSEVTTDDGIALTLTSASYALADLRFEYPAQTTASLWEALSPIASAYAHPGHDFNGGIGGELLGSWTIDLLAGPSELGQAAIYDGEYATGHLTLPPEGTVALTGTASTAAGERAFRFELLPDQEVTGIPFEVTIDPDRPPTGITLDVDLGHALSFVDWTTEDADGDDVLTSADGALENTVSFGVVATPSFHLSLEN